jgi:hypothetical protein
VPEKLIIHRKGCVGSPVFPTSFFLASFFLASFFLAKRPDVSLAVREAGRACRSRYRDKAKTNAFRTFQAKLEVRNMSHNPLDDSDEAAQHRIRERAYHLWEADGRPEGRADEYWERARELVGIEESPHAGEIPVREDRPEEASIQQNLGEFPGRFTDQGEQTPTPSLTARVKPEPVSN